MITPLRSGRGHRRQGFLRASALFALAWTVVFSSSARAMITGGAGNKPIADPGWPKGAAAIFNHPARIAWWEGHAVRGGQWHAEFRGDARTLNAMLAGFARLDVKTKRIIIHDGVGASFWLNPNREASKQKAARMDWEFIVWQPAIWEQAEQAARRSQPDRSARRRQGPSSTVRHLHRRQSPLVRRGRSQGARSH